MKTISKILVSALAAVAAMASANAQGTKIDTTLMLSLADHPNTVKGAVYADPTADPAARAFDLIRRMTFEEKALLTGGYKSFFTQGIARLGIRPVNMTDASQGARLGCTTLRTKSTSFTSMLALSSAWRPDLAYEMGAAIAAETRMLGADILLAPSANLQRLSEGGRNFEYTGEDPYLTAEIVAEYTKGVQEAGVIATPKVLIGNEQDFCRHIASSDIDERALREIYLPVWEKCISYAGAQALMVGNNLYNGLHCSMSRELIHDICIGEYGFDGIAMTDWQNSCYFPKLQYMIPLSGITLMMSNNAALMEYVNAECAVSEARKAEMEVLMEKMIYPNLKALFSIGAFDRHFCTKPDESAYARSRQIARTCAEEGIVLLKNKGGILPIAKGRKILLAGPKELHSGTGSGFVDGYGHVSFADALKAEYGDNFTAEEKPSDKAVKAADVVLFNLNKDAGEARDIPFEFPVEDLEYLRHIISLNRNVVVLVNACNVMPTDWLKDVKGLLWCYFLGQERGNALAAVISGRTNPSGHLPFTIEKDFADSPSPEFNYIGGEPYWRGGNDAYKQYWLGLAPATKDRFSQFVKPGEIVHVPYSEGIFMGYRWYDKKGIDVVYPFGYGLSYTTFKYESIKVENSFTADGHVTVSVTVRNTGRKTGKEVVQLYVSDPQCSVERPVKELKGFGKIELAPGQSGTVTMVLDSRSFSFWDVQTHSWKLENGKFVLRAGGSSASLPLAQEITL